MTLYPSHSAHPTAPICRDKAPAVATVAPRPLAEPARLWAITAGALVLAGAAQAALIALAQHDGFEIQQVFRDPNGIAHQPFYFGAASSLGIVVMLGAGSVALFAGAIVRSLTAGMAGFLLVGGLLTLALAGDDLFMAHEELLPRLGVSEHLVFILYAVVAPVWLLAALPRLWKRHLIRLPLIVLAGACLATSVLIDVGYRGYTAWEDATKLFGYVLWACFLVSISLAEAERAIACREGNAP